MKIGGVYLYKNKKFVYIISGQYTGGYGRVCNFWKFRYINKDGTLGKESGDYNNSDDKFIPIEDAIVEIKILLPKKIRR